MSNKLHIFLKEIGQTDLLDSLSSIKKKTLLAQLKQLQKNWEGGPSPLQNQGSFSPIHDPEIFGSHPLEKKGEEILASGKAGCVLLCGGLGTRLSFNGPKGCFPISCVEKKSLFQLLFEKVYFLQKKWKCELPLALLVSSFNHQETVSFLKKHRFFGLKSSQVTILEQPNYPYFESSGNLILSKTKTLLSSPNGNGGFYEAFCNSPLLKRWGKKGIEFVHLIAVDNPLANPCDTYLLGYMDAIQAEAGIKVIKRANTKEKVGLVVKKGSAIVVKDYMEISGDLEKRQSEYTLANIGQYCFRLPFLKRVALEKLKIPLHWVKKDHPVEKKNPLVWKGEKFVMDLLEFSKKTAVVVYPREEVFAPLKNLKGEDSVKVVQRALQIRDQRIFEAIFQKKAPKTRFELSTEFLYPTEASLKKWKEKMPPKRGYIE